MASDSDHSALYSSWSCQLHELYTAWTLTNVQFAVGARPGSRAAHDDAELAARFPDLTKPEGTGAGIDAVQMIDAAAQHMRALKALVDTRTVALTPWPIARAIAEHVAHAGWLLEPDLAPEARMARRWMARLAAAQRARWLADARKLPNARVREFKKLRDAMRQQVLQRFPGMELEWNDPATMPPWVIAGETFPGLGQQVRALSVHGADKVAGLYDTFSLFSHPNPMALSAQSATTNVGTHLVVGYRADAEELRSLVTGASSLVYLAAQAACRYLGCANDELLTSWFETYLA
ncbi:MULTISPECIES: hypothetical protein [Nocardia]|uniref:Uncharacterized protein n=1 Tax=Nocardia nova TaxID=37330 RepID=A0A2T2ZE16_9NOCA|nr:MULTISPECIES: hypothetical protein [Nocardia]PSR66011.1 hypothetical protein C8259_01230 [Nocardia nova]